MYIPAKINANLARILQKYLLLPLLYFIIPTISFAQNSSDSLFQQKKVIQDSLIKSGFWEAQVEIDENDNLQILKGRPYYWHSINVSEDQLTSDIPFLKKLKGEVANQFVLNIQIKEYIIENYHRNGYPLAKASLSIDNLNDNQIQASINIIAQNYILNDSLNIEGDSQVVNSTYLSNVLDLEYDKPFDIKAFNNITDKISELEYISLSSLPQLAFANNKAIINLKIKEERVNQFDAIIGLVPEGSRTNLTGQVDARLRNLFKRGVGIDMFWQKYSANSQFLNTRIQQSNAFRSPLGVNFGFELLQEDSTFLQTELQIGTYYPLWNALKVGLSYQRFTNNILRDFSETEVLNIDPFRSSMVNAVLLNLEWKRPLTYPELEDYIFAQSNFSFGQKEIINYSALPMAWQNVPENSNTIRGGFKIHMQKVLWKRFLLEVIPQYRAIQNPALSQNDLQRLGGLQNLRGFDRNFFYTRYFGLLNLNYRYFLDQKSSFFLLTDFAKLLANVGWVYATGAGLDIKSQNGWFRIIYALGQETGNMPDFSQGKVHFGYIAVF
ncbi:hypothetical protein QYS49_33510 [Marivirga salinae]|uniref:Bacterial surface antigen (D15) domain-containing protein n=1 Tax=Marivirga salinarum TaxID=3059078 RepID=A0AA51NC48_9BACT|nr:hypothetical protein [Marivirga sp. BDSF4-3]WMN12413.1 hypothetical protein QYS49_33510 [Marivirga sp. BDSF4-3]